MPIAGSGGDTDQAKANLTKAGIPFSSRIVESGAKTKIWVTMVTLDPDCSSRGLFKMGIVQAPRHGEVIMEQGEDYPGYPANHARANCNNQKVPIAFIVYTSEPGYTGEDFFAVDFARSDAGEARGAFFLTVRKF